MYSALGWNSTVRTIVKSNTMLCKYKKNKKNKKHFHFISCKVCLDKREAVAACTESRVACRCCRRLRGWDMDVSAGGLYLPLLRLHEWVSLAVGISSTINTAREILKWVTFCYRQGWIKSLLCIQEEWDAGLAINSAWIQNMLKICLYMNWVMEK